MMRLKHTAPVAWAAASLFFISGFAFAAGKSEQARAGNFGIGHPRTVQDLPNGKLRNDLQRLPAKARGKALGRLQSFEFPVEDLASLQVSEAGDVAYADHFEHAEAIDGLDGGETQAFTEALISENDVFQLHSRPGSGNVMYLDFDGHVLDGTGWSRDVLVGLPFDPSGNDSPATEANFTQDEINRIFEIWHRISEDYAAFDIDITTEEPAQFGPTTGRVLFTHDVDANGVSMPHEGAGGVAFINSFGHEYMGWYYTPAFVYYTNLTSSSPGLPERLAEAASHEIGHTMGLSHDGTTSGATYYTGHGEGLVSWAPIMGLPYDKNVTNWSPGDYSGANNQQDDLAVIAEKLGYIGDDHANSSSGATPLVIEPNGDIVVSSPEIDPDNLLNQNKGVIDDGGDTDWFYFDVAGNGSINLAVTPAWHSFRRETARGSNLDVEATLIDQDMSIVDWDNPDDDTVASLTATLVEGRYYLKIDGSGNDSLSEYSDYASAGMYFIEGVLTVEETQEPVDTTPPSPGTMSWSEAPRATGTSSMTMTAVQATDDSGLVEYYFTCVTGEQGCADSGWQSSRTYSLDGLSPETYYAFTVKARDGSLNVNSASPAEGDTTEAEAVVANEPPVAMASYSPTPPAITKGKSVSVTLDGSASSDSDGTIAAWSWRDGNGDEVSTASRFSQNLKEGDYAFTLTVTDDSGASDSTSVRFTVSKAGDSNNRGKPGKK